MPMSRRARPAGVTIEPPRTTSSWVTVFRPCANASTNSSSTSRATATSSIAHRLVGMVAHAAGRAHEQHRDRGHVGEDHGVVAGAADERGRVDAARRGGCRQQRAQARIARDRGGVLELERSQLHAALGREQAGVGRRSTPRPRGGTSSSGDRRSMLSVTRPGITLAAPGSTDSSPTVATRSSEARAMRVDPLDDARRGDQRVAAERHRDRPRVPRRAVQLQTCARAPGDRRDDADVPVERLEQRTLLDVQLDVAEQRLAAPRLARDRVRSHRRRPGSRRASRCRPRLGGRGPRAGSSLPRPGCRGRGSRSADPPRRRTPSTSSANGSDAPASRSASAIPASTPSGPS